MQPVRQVVHAASDLLRAVQRLGGEVLCVSLNDAGELLEIDFKQRHLLADVVVQVARDPRAFRFLRVQQARAEVADAIVTRCSSTWFLRTCASAWRRRPC